MFLAILIFGLNWPFCKGIAFAQAMAFAKRPIFKIVSFLEDMGFFQAVFAQNSSNAVVQLFFACFCQF